MSKTRTSIARATTGLIALVLVASACIPVGPAPHRSGEWLQDGASIASDGTNALMVWRDYRNGNGGDIYGAIVTPDNTVVLTDIAISVQPGTESSPDVAFDGTNYLVAWSDRRSGDANVMASRISPAGQVLDPTGFTIAGGPGEQQRPAVAFDGTQYLVVFEDTQSNSGGDLVARRVSPDTTILDPTSIALEASPNDSILADVSADASGFVVAWLDEASASDIRVLATRVTAAGVPAAPPLELTDQAFNWYGATTNVSLTFDGSLTMAVYDTAPFPCCQGSDIWARQIDQSGQLVGTGPIDIDTNDGRGAWPRHPNVAYDGTNYVVSYQRPSDSGAFFHVVRIDATGAAVTPHKKIRIADESLWSDHEAQALIAAGDTVILTTESARIAPGAPSGVGFYALANSDQSGGFGYGQPITAGTADQTIGAIAYGDGVHLVVWSDYQGVYARRFDALAQPLDSEPIEIDLAPGDDDVLIEYNGTNFVIVGQAPSGFGFHKQIITIGIAGPVINSVLQFGSDPLKLASTASGQSMLAWSVLGNTQAVFIDVDGVIESGPTAIAPPATQSLQLAGTSDGYVATWRLPGNGTPRSTIVGTLVDESGVASTPAGTILLTSDDSLVHRIASSGTDLLLVTSNFTTDDVIAQTFDLSFAPTGPQLLVANGDFSEMHLDHGNNYIVALSEFVSMPPSEFDIVVASIDGTTVGQRELHGSPIASSSSLSLSPGGPNLAAVLFEQIDPATGSLIVTWNRFLD